MPRRSRATSRIGRSVAACAISISDFGFWCCETDMKTPLRLGSAEADSGLEVDSSGEVCRRGFCRRRPVCTRRTRMRPSAQTTENPSLPISTTSPSFPAIPFGSFAGSGLASIDLQRLAVDGCPRAGGRIAAADQVVNLPPRFAPVDARVFRAATAFIGGERLHPV